ncbi:hypothetical protein MXMO3_01756 [Maritalea myrionectae]|uniref:DUF7694 domain-containing protein n=1 Tax=Maritalea myrionectae TaxID=454601 RepID=A0A2R4ME19_9HYPH|nr:hypothetical protein [Maritalea myrionectae]AVX04281.1 hypothetical protein MXMO3_01756 [Maritalea myrionectae]
MKDLSELRDYRISDAERRIYGRSFFPGCGCFAIKSPIDGGQLFVIVSTGGGWEHVSVSRKNRCPNWPEMSHIKNLFFEPDEVAMQIHVAESDHVNFHANCLHLWKPMNADIPLPPSEMVGPKGGAA